jgi:arylsulfatase A-like enzyme
VVAIWRARAEGYLRQQGETDIAFQARRRDWFLARRTEETPPSLIPLLPDDPIIVLITLDALRADLVAQPKHLRQLPTLRRLKEQSVYFSEARAPSCQTVTTLSSMFSGLYFSQQRWSRDPESSASFPGDDTTPRFPQLFQQARVPTVVAPAAYFLVNEYGVVRGFDEQASPRTPSLNKTGFTDGAHLSERAIEVLQGHEGGALFLYVHYLDARYPYSAGEPRSPGFERYLGALSYIDQQVGRVLRATRRLGLWDRAVVVLASDYGDALGEHDSTHDAKTLYEEQLHVPLMIRVPGVRSRRVNQMVSLMDVGPTLLDMMGLHTPAHFMGQSLTPYLSGRGAPLTRPIVAEMRSKKALYFADGYKLIVDDGQHTEELYHLETDPKERVNVIDKPSAKGRQRVAQLRQFFDTHRHARPRHEVP